MYTALLQYAKEHEMTVKDFNRHKSNRGTAQPTMINAIESLNMVRRAVETAAQAKRAVHTEVAPTNVALIKCVVNAVR